MVSDGLSCVGRFSPTGADTVENKRHTQMKTRADLKRELSQTIPHGDETAYLSKVEAQLTAARTRLQDLRARRVALSRRISVRERKKQDWKGKIPRREPPTQQLAISELSRLGSMPTHAVACATDRALRFETPFRTALTGVNGFQFVWVLLYAHGEEEMCHASCVGCVMLRLVGVEQCHVKEGLLVVDSSLPNLPVLDVKPYLSYCEAVSFQSSS